jgi:glucan 1,3-beta-glucosidase
MTNILPTVLVAGIHWLTAQSTSLQNLILKMSSVSGTQHEGIFIGSGSGGFVTDLTFFGGLHGATFGNQQFTMRNLVLNNAVVAIIQLWDWGWTYKGITVNNCGIGLDISAGGPSALSVESVVFPDSKITNTPVGIRMGRNVNSAPPSANSLILESN